MPITCSDTARRRLWFYNFSRIFKRPFVGETHPKTVFDTHSNLRFWSQLFFALRFQFQITIWVVNEQEAEMIQKFAIFCCDSIFCCCCLFSATLELILYITIFGLYFPNSICRKNFSRFPRKETNLSWVSIRCELFRVKGASATSISSIWRMHRIRQVRKCVYHRLTSLYRSRFSVLSVSSQCHRIPKAFGWRACERIRWNCFFFIWFLFLLLHMI